MHIHITDIDWETDGESPEKCGLPSEGWFEIESERPDELTEGEMDGLTDMLSERYGYLINGFKYEIGLK